MQGSKKRPKFRFPLRQFHKTKFSEAVTKLLTLFGSIGCRCCCNPLGAKVDPPCHFFV